MELKAFCMKRFFTGGIKGKRFEIDQRVMDEEEVNRRIVNAALQSSFWFDEYFDLKPGTYTRLRDNKENQTMMSDMPMEIRTNAPFVAAAHGRVLIAGLGIGLILMSIQDKEDVEFICVVEIHKEIIDLITKQLPLNGKVKIIHADIFKLNLKKGTKFDIIYFDIWNDICGDNYEPSKKLHRKFSRYLNRENPRAWMDSWRREDFKRMSMG